MMDDYLVIGQLEIDDMRRRIAALEAENAKLRNATQDPFSITRIAALEQQLAQTWQPVGGQHHNDGYSYTDPNGVMIYLEDRYYMEMVKDDREMVAMLDTDHAFCRRVPAAPDPLTHLVPPLSEWPDDAVAPQRTQLAAAQARTWQPVENGYTYRCQCTECAAPDAWRWDLYVTAVRDNTVIGICASDNDEDDRYVELPDNVRLCRVVPAAPDPLAHLVPPLTEWPENAEAWMVDADGVVYWLYGYNDNVSTFWIADSTDGDDYHTENVQLPPGFNWRDSLRLRPQPEVTP